MLDKVSIAHRLLPQGPLIKRKTLIMSNKHKIHFYGEGQPSPVIIEIVEQGSFLEAVVAAQQAGVIAAEVNLKELHIFAIDEEEPLEPGQKITSTENRLKLHCHRGRRIEVSVTFNMVKKSRTFSPSTLVDKVLKWALHEFGLKGADAENKELRL